MDNGMFLPRGYIVRSHDDVVVCVPMDIRPDWLHCGLGLFDQPSMLRNIATTQSIRTHQPG